MYLIKFELTFYELTEHLIGIYMYMYPPLSYSATPIPLIFLPPTLLLHSCHLHYYYTSTTPTTATTAPPPHHHTTPPGMITYSGCKTRQLQRPFFDSYASIRQAPEQYGSVFAGGKECDEGLFKHRRQYIRDVVRKEEEEEGRARGEMYRWGVGEMEKREGGVGVRRRRVVGRRVVVRRRVEVKGGRKRGVETDEGRGGKRVKVGGKKRRVEEEREKKMEEEREKRVEEGVELERLKLMWERVKAGSNRSKVDSPVENLPRTGSGNETNSLDASSNILAGETNSFCGTNGEEVLDELAELFGSSQIVLDQ